MKSIELHPNEPIFTRVTFEVSKPKGLKVEKKNRLGEVKVDDINVTFSHW